MEKMTNGTVLDVLKSSGFSKLLNNLDTESAYDLSVLFSKIEAQAKIIEENRKRLVLKFFPKDENGLQKTSINKETATSEEIAEYEKNLKDFSEEFNIILNKEIELDFKKIEIKKQDLKNLKLTALDILALEGKILKIN